MSRPGRSPGIAPLVLMACGLAVAHSCTAATKNPSSGGGYDGPANGTSADAPGPSGVGGGAGAGFDTAADATAAAARDSETMERREDAPPMGTGGSAGVGGGMAEDAGSTGGMGGSGAGDGRPPRPTVVLFLIDGLEPESAQTAAANGATNIKLVIENGVTVEVARSTSPAPRTTLPDGTLPWGNATSGNIAIHTGTHLFEAGPAGMDDIFLAARAVGIKGVFSGGGDNYAGLTTADFHYAGAQTDEQVLQRALSHFKSDQVQLIRIHLQRVRSSWTGPADRTNPNSAYIRHIVANDGLLGKLIATLKDAKVWEDTYLIVTSDHGMGQTSASNHPPSVASSWGIFMGFYGPGLKRGATIPYAELPDVAVTTAHFLGLQPLAGHTAPSVDLARKGTTGTLLTNLFLGSPTDISHPRFIDRYLQMGAYRTSGDTYGPYRTAMLSLIK